MSFSEQSKKNADAFEQEETKGAEGESSSGTLYPPLHTFNLAYEPNGDFFHYSKVVPSNLSKYEFPP